MKTKTKIFISMKLVSVLCVGLFGCANQSGSTDETTAPANAAEAVDQSDSDSGFFGFLETEETYTVPAGTALVFELGETLSTESNEGGDTFEARLTEPIIVDGETLIPAGAKARGRITELQESGRVEGRAEIRLVMSEILHEGRTYRISTDGYYAVAEATTGDDAVKIGAGTGIGAVIGGIVGGGKGAAAGAAIGGGGGTAVVLATKGRDIELVAGTRINFVLNEPLEITS